MENAYKMDNGSSIVLFIFLFIFLFHHSSSCMLPEAVYVIFIEQSCWSGGEMTDGEIKILCSLCLSHCVNKWGKNY